MNHVFFVFLGLDAAVLVIIGHCVYAAAKKGFLQTVAQMAAYLAVVFVASVISRAAAPLIYDRLVEPMLFGNGGATDNEHLKLLDDPIYRAIKLLFQQKQPPSETEQDGHEHNNVP